METLYLLGSIVYTFLGSIILFLFIPLCYFFTLLRSVKAMTNDLEAVSLYEGTVRHKQRRPVCHSFQYTSRYALFNLDCASNVPIDHLSANDTRRRWHTPLGQCSLLLTIPPSLGYEQNPLSLYHCYNMEGSILHITEVTNTPWGERVTFLFNPGSD